MVALAAVGMAASLGLTGCALVDEFTSHQKERVFATVADALADSSGDGDGDATFMPPPFVPGDATDLKIRVITNGPGDIIRFTSASPLPDDTCDAGALVGSPLLESTWWPAEVPTEGIVCDSDWQVFQVNGNTYAWVSV